MKLKLVLITGVVLLNSCATGYVTIDPKNQNYASSDEKDNIKIEYKYNVLKKKYAKKEIKKNINVVAIKITNNSENDQIFGENMVVTNSQGTTINLLNTEEIFKP